MCPIGASMSDHRTTRLWAGWACPQGWPHGPLRRVFNIPSTRLRLKTWRVVSGLEEEQETMPEVVDLASRCAAPPAPTPTPSLKLPRRRAA